MNYRLILPLMLTSSLFPILCPSALADESADKAAAKITYDEHVRPILREHCFTCHNQNGAKGGLVLDSYAKLIAGGSSGEVVIEQDLESSRLWALISHEEEPFMPPGQDKLPEAKLATIRQWIEGGLLENSGATAAPKKKKMLDLVVPSSTGKPEGPAAMPESLAREPVVYTPRAGAVAAVAASPWAPLVAVSGQQQVLLYNSQSGELLGVLPFPEGIAYSLRFSRDGSKLLAGGGRGGASGDAVLFDVRTGERLVKVGDELDVVLTADINNDLTRIALGGPGKLVRIFSTQTGEMLHEIRKHTDWIYAVRFSPDGVLLATADRSNGLFVWEAETAREYLDLRGHTAAVTDVDWQSDSNVLASASLDGTIRLWEMNNGNQIARANAHGDGVNAIAYTHDGKLVTAGQDRTAKMWDPGLKPLQTFPAFNEPALRVTFTHDGQRVVAGDWSGEVKMWEAGDAREVAHLPANPPTIAMRIAASEQELQAARDAATAAVAALAAVEQQVKDAGSKHAAAVEAAETSATQASQLVEKAKADLVAQSAQVEAANAAVQEAQRAMDEAKKALEAATAKAAQMTTALAQTREREQAIQKQVPEAEAALQKAQGDAAALKTQAAKESEELVKQMAPKKEAADAAQARAAQLQSILEKLQAEKAALEEAAKQASAPEKE